MGFLKALPLPACAVALGCAALGNLLQAVFGNLLGMPEVGTNVRWLLGAISALFTILVILKALLLTKGVKEALNDPVALGVFSTFPMTLMLLAAYIKPFIGQSAIWLWYVGIAIHAAIILVFTKRYVMSFALERALTPWFIVYVGIAVAGITAPSFDMIPVGNAAFWFGLVSLVVLLPIVGKRYASLPVKEPAAPLFCIFSAPTSLCIASGIQSGSPKVPELFLALLALASVLFLITLVRLPKLVTLKFFPSCAAFTFPYVITGIATMQSMAFLANNGYPMPWLRWLVLAEAALAAILTLWTVLRYISASMCQPK